VNYGLMLVRRGRLNEGRLQLESVLTKAEARYNVGSVYEALGRREQAKGEFKAALALDASMADAQARLDALEGVVRQPPPARPPEPAVVEKQPEVTVPEVTVPEATIPEAPAVVQTPAEAAPAVEPQPEEGAAPTGVTRTDDGLSGGD
jgi:hypothetical protein